MSKFKDIKTALIGAGVMGNHHARILNEISNFSVVCDPDRVQAHPIVSKYGVTYCSDISQIPEEIDSVVIAAPTAYHEEIALDLLNSGKNMLIEKPLSHTVSSGQKILKQCQKSNATVAVGQIERFNPVIEKAKEKIINGDWGDIVSISARRFSPYPTRVTDVGVILDMGIHDIDLIRYLFAKEVTKVSASGGSFKHNNLEDYANISINFEDNKVGLCETNWLSPCKVRKISMITSSHYVILDLLNREIFQICDTEAKDMDMSDMEKIPVDQKNALRSELLNFLSATKSDAPPLITVEDGLESIRIAEIALTAINKG